MASASRTAGMRYLDLAVGPTATGTPFPTGTPQPGPAPVPAPAETPGFTTNGTAPTPGQYGCVAGHVGSAIGSLAEGAGFAAVAVTAPILAAGEAIQGGPGIVTSVVGLVSVPFFAGAAALIAQGRSELGGAG